MFHGIHFFILIVLYCTKSAKICAQKLKLQEKRTISVRFFYACQSTHFQYHPESGFCKFYTIMLLIFMLNSFYHNVLNCTLTCDIIIILNGKEENVWKSSLSSLFVLCFVQAFSFRFAWLSIILIITVRVKTVSFAVMLHCKENC